MRSSTVPTIGCSLVLLLSACGGNAPITPSPVTEEDSSSSVAAAESTYVGVLGSSVIGIYMEGTHRLQTAAGVDILLRSDSVDLDAYLGQTVAVTGIAQPTVEQGGTIMDVRSVEALSEPAPEPETSSSSAAASSVQAAVASSSVQAAVASSVSSVARVAASSKASSVAQSSSVAIASSSAASSVIVSGGPNKDEQVAAMAKAKVEASTFTQIFCSSHVGFCIPLHKSWYYNSFGATSTTLWHVEVSSQAVEKLGDGPLIINLVSGALPASIQDESVVDQGNFVIGYRAWTNNRHFEISAPVELRSSVAYMVSALSVYQVDAASSRSSVPATSSASSL